MSDRRQEKIGWIGGWFGGFIWVLILSVVLVHVSFDRKLASCRGCLQGEYVVIAGWVPMR